MSINDRDQKAQALRYCVAKRWFPQLEVDVHPGTIVGKKPALVTDLDVLAFIPDEFCGLRSVVFDCKTRARESAVNRSMWLRGILDLVQAEIGICILKKSAIEPDHKLAATDLEIVLLAEDEFDIFANATCAGFAQPVGASGDIRAWETLFRIPSKYPSLESSLHFMRSEFWMQKDVASSCRRVIANLLEVRGELDPDKPEHVCIARDMAALFSHSLAKMCNYLFKAYLHPKNQVDLEEAIKIIIYGGRESYLHRNSLYKLLKQQGGANGAVEELSLPEWDRFIKLVRQLLDAPVDVARVPLILREVGFQLIRTPVDHSFAKTLCGEAPQAARFAVLIAGYLFKAARLPEDFRKGVETEILGYMSS